MGCTRKYPSFLGLTHLAIYCPFEVPLPLGISNDFFLEEWVKGGGGRGKYFSDLHMSISWVYNGT